MRVIMQTFGAVLGVVVLGALLLDEGEVVTLVGHHGGREYETQLWIVEVEGRDYLRARDPGADWLRRLGSAAYVQLRRGHGASAPLEPYEATPTLDAALRESVDRAMAAKYGLADRVWSMVAGDSSSVPVALEPAEPAHAEGEGGEDRELRVQPDAKPGGVS